MIVSEQFDSKELRGKNPETGSRLAILALLCVPFGLIAPFIDYVMAYIGIVSETYFVAFTPFRIVSMVFFALAVVLGISAMIIPCKGRKIRCRCCAIVAIVFGIVLGLLEYGGCKLVERFLARHEESAEIVTNEYQIGYLTDKVLEYAEKNNGYLPVADKWCEELVISIPNLTPDSFLHYNQKNGKCGFAFNKNLSGLKVTDVRKDVVLLFESEGPLNLNGNAQLFESNLTNRTVAIPVSFADGAFGRYWLEFKESECRTRDGNYENRSLRWNP